MENTVVPMPLISTEQGQKYPYLGYTIRDWEQFLNCLQP